MVRYCRPEVKTFDSPAMLEVLGPAMAQYEATMNLYGGRTAGLDGHQPGEYRLVKADMDYGIINQEEVSHA